MSSSSVFQHQKSLLSLEQQASLATLLLPLSIKKGMATFAENKLLSGESWFCAEYCFGTVQQPCKCMGTTCVMS